MLVFQRTRARKAARRPSCNPAPNVKDPSSSPLSGRIALVTGGTRGLGRHIASALLTAGAHVAITSREIGRAQQAAADLMASHPGGECAGFGCDQSDPKAIASLPAAVRQTIGDPDLLVNNAAAFAGDRVLTMTLAQWNGSIQTNLTGVFLTTKAFLPAMISRRRGDLFMIGSMSGKKGDPGSSAYAASKFGLRGFAQALLYEVRRKNIRVMVLNPSSIDTGPNDGPPAGPGLHLHAVDIGATIVHLATLPGRTLIPDMDIWGTNPFPS